MKKQNPDIPFMVQIRYHKGILHLPDEAAIDKLILDSRGLLLCDEGAYFYISSRTVCNAARVLRDTVRSQRSKTVRLQLEFTHFGETAIDVELGKAIEVMSTEIKTLQKKHEESYPEATSGG